MINSSDNVPYDGCMQCNLCKNVQIKYLFQPEVIFVLFVEI